MLEFNFFDACLIFFDASAVWGVRLVGSSSSELFEFGACVGILRDCSLKVQGFGHSITVH